jgi:hypothetical protein
MTVFPNTPDLKWSVRGHLDEAEIEDRVEVGCDVDRHLRGVQVDDGHDGITEDIVAKGPGTDVVIFFISPKHLAKKLTFYSKYC